MPDLETGSHSHHPLSSALQAPQASSLNTEYGNQKKLKIGNLMGKRRRKKKGKLRAGRVSVRKASAEDLARFGVKQLPAPPKESWTKDEDERLWRLSGMEGVRLDHLEDVLGRSRGAIAERICHLVDHS